jgi:hypothetical protein
MSFAGGGAYSAAKFALEGLSEALADEIGPHGIRTLIVEPGAFRTELMGSHFGRSRELDAYADTVGRARAYLDSAHGTQPGDPRKAATAIIAALAAPDPPLRLALGADAVDAIRAKHERLRADLDGWEAASRDTAFDEQLAKLFRPPQRRRLILMAVTSPHCGEQIRRRIHGHSARRHDPGGPWQSR